MINTRAPDGANKSTKNSKQMVYNGFSHLAEYILYFHRRQISVDCWRSHLIPLQKIFFIETLNLTVKKQAPNASEERSKQTPEKTTEQTYKQTPKKIPEQTPKQTFEQTSVTFRALKAFRAIRTTGLTGTFKKVLETETISYTLKSNCPVKFSSFCFLTEWAEESCYNHASAMSKTKKDNW